RCETRVSVVPTSLQNRPRYSGSNIHTYHRENSVNHFGIAFGVIVVAVLGGAFAFDRTVAKKEIAQPAAVTASATTPTPAQPESTVAAEAPAEAPKIKLAEVAPIEPKQHAVRKVAPAPVRTTPIETPAAVQAPMPTPA